MAAHIAALRADEHSAFRVVPVIDERVAFPMTRDKVTSESVFQVAGIVQGVIKSNDVPAAGALRGLVAFPVPPIVAGVDDVRNVGRTDQAGLFHGVHAFADCDLGHDFRDFVSQGLKAADILDQVVLFHAHGAPSFLLYLVEIGGLDGRGDGGTDANHDAVAADLDHVVDVIVGLEGPSVVGDSVQDFRLVTLREGLRRGRGRNLDLLADADHIRVFDPVVGGDLLVGGPMLRRDRGQGVALLHGVDGHALAGSGVGRGVSHAQAAVHFGRDLPVSVIQIVAGTGLVRVVTVNGHITAVFVVHAVRLLGGPHKFLDPVPLANIGHKVKKRGEGPVIYCVGVFGVAGDLDRHGAVVVCGAGTAPGPVLFLHIHSDLSVGSDAIVRRRLARSRGEDVPQGFDRTLADHTMNCDRVDLVVSGAVLIG